ncbi:uncharacterized protein EAF02_006203 [Botrytis sinoallii]|uniref:uncharacterized protein n=1 Tax=Botrytis sinoallii TaxID=1463999 RepID=UPI001902653C|nr:uncharacterized protein EAF02_006203 [Botrytis sinoallii]KAF7882840.1 hypothetical protein EAF02_006203 [Botrytis sinoallii]
MDEEKDKRSRTLVEKEIFPENGQPKELLEDVEDSSDRYLTGWRLTLVTISLALGMFLTGVDSSVIGVATPGITTSFHTIDDLAWYGSGYMLPHTALQPIIGAFYKSFNVRYVFLISIIIFEVGSCLCAAAPTSAAFIIGRVIAGCGAAGLLQGTLAIVRLSVPKRKIPLYYGHVLSVQGPTTSDPLLQKSQRMDWAGTIIFLSAFVCLYLALQWGGQTKPWRSSEVIGLFIGFGLLLGLFAYTQKFTGENSLIPRGILKQQTVLFGTIYLILFGLQMAVYLQYIPIYFQAVRGTSALNIGVRMIAMDAGRIVFIIISGILVTKFGHYMPYMVVGTIITVIAAGLLTMFDLNTSTAHSTAFMFLTGAGAGIGGNQPFTALQAALKYGSSIYLSTSTF